jgi:hypothetical protein
MIEVLKLIASPYDAQLVALPNFVVLTDEIALLYGDELKLVKAQGLFDRLSPEVREGLAGIDDVLERMSDDTSLWTNESLRARPEWHGLRAQASQILSLLGQESGLPRPFWTTYIEGSR